ncbi:MAG: SDR family NAD(P)-dependent oxidoreductase, partial [Ilumatobacteraceae bacterium]
RIVDINITGSVNTLRGAYPILTEAGRGSIVLMASLAGLMGTPLLAAYGMSKAALVGLGASVRPEAARHGVGVTVVCPGPVETGMLDSPAATPGVSPRRFLTAAAGQPMTPQRLAKHVVHAVRTDRGLVVPGRSGLLWRVARMSPRVAGALTAAGLRRELAAAEPGQVAPSG